MKTPQSDTHLLRKKLEGWRAVAWASAKRLGQVDAFDLAGSLTFTTVLAIVPLLAVALALFTAFPQFHELSDALQTFLTNSLMPPVVSENVMAYLNEFARQATRLTAIGGSFLIVTVLLLILSVDKALNEIWLVTQPRGIGHRLLVYWTLLTLGPLLTGASLWATAVLAQASFGVISHMPILLELTLKVSPFLVSIAGFAALFIVVPNARVSLRDGLIGGVLVAVLLALMKLGFAYYLSQISTYTTIYGAFAVLPVFLIWVYLSWLSVLFGAIVVANLPYLRQAGMRTHEQAGDPFHDALKILTMLNPSRTRQPPGLTSINITEKLHLPLDRTEALLGQLQELGLIAVTQTRKYQHWVLVCDLKQTDISSIANHFLLNRHAMRLDEDSALRLALADFIHNKKDTMLSDVLLHNDKPE